MKTYNTSPYFDDFDESKDFHQIMFKPGVAVQARELTQLQTILRNQIEKFGNHIFQHGSVVIPGNSFADLAVPYLKLQNVYNTISINADNYAEKYIVGKTSGVRAYVQKALPKTDTDPVTLYLSYVGGSGSTGVVSFQDGEEIYVEFEGQDSGIGAIAQQTDSTGIGSLAYINSGVYYINGTFTSVSRQSVVIDKYSSSPSCSILLKIDEDIITSFQDNTLLDNAQGSFNYAAPGADRVKITLTLTSIDLNTPITDDYVEIMRYRNGVLEQHSKTPKYSELEKSLARRTFEQSGNYVVRGLEATVREHLKRNGNGGVFSDGNDDLLVVDVNPGKAYINGFEVEKISSTKIDIEKGRTENHIKNTNIAIRPEFGQYIIVSGIFGGLDLRNRQLVDIYNDDDSTNSSATKIGTLRAIGIDYLAGDVATGAIYKLWVTDISLITGVNIESAGGIRYGSGKRAKVLTEYKAPITGGGFEKDELISHVSGRTATVEYWNPTTATLYAYKHDHTQETPKVGDLITGSSSGTTSTITYKDLIVSVGQNGLVFKLPKNTPFSLIDPQTNSYNLNYKVQKEFTITTDENGNGSASVSSGEQINSPEVGTFVAIGPNGVINIENDNFNVNSAGTILFLNDGPASSSIKVYASVTKTNVFPKTKTETTITEIFESPSNIVTLSKADAIRIDSVIDSVGDITANYILLNGQTDYAYTNSKIRLRAGSPPPNGSITVTYTYYEHSAFGDFFTIDSYPENILETDTLFVSESTGEVFDLPACLDFRPTIGQNGEFTGIGAKTNDLIISGTAFNSTLRYYVPRIDVLAINSFSNLSVIKGVPSENPRVPNVPKNLFPLNIIYVPEYTKSIFDVNNERLPVERYTMRDIHRVSERIDRVEEFVTLSAEEQVTINYDIADAVTGLDRFKTGYLVENFERPFSIARSTSPDFAATFVVKELSPSMEDLICNFKFLQDSSSHYVISGRKIMLPYTEEVFASQLLSSRVTNLNPFLVISWNGELDVFPSSDDWVEVRELPTIFETRENVVFRDVFVPAPEPPRPEPPPEVEPITPRPAEPSEPPIPSVTFEAGGLYGTVLGREGEAEGVAHWIRENRALGARQAVANFMDAAREHFLQGTEAQFNEVRFDDFNGEIVLTSEIETVTTNGVTTSTETGILLNGETFSRTL